MSVVSKQRAYTAVLSVVCGLGCTGLLAGCGPSANPPSGAAEAPEGRTVRNASAGSQRSRQAAFLNRIRQSDPQYQTIEKAILNENNELGLILARNVDMESIPKLMQAMLTQMSREFRNQDLTVIAYAPSQPPIRIGTAHLNARTGQMTYTPERQ